jgi:UDP-glucose 4-epimerase
MRILITGASGLISGRLAVHLSQAGHQLILGSRAEVIAHSWLPTAETTRLWWNDSAALKSICKNVDVVIHSAGMNARDCEADPMAALAFNGVATARLVSAAINSGVQKFIYFSTAHVYTNPLVGVISEKTCPRNLHPYATSHLAGEKALLFANQNKKIRGIVLRLSNTFGAPTDKRSNCWELLINDLCRQAVQTRKLVLRSSGLQQRDFIELSAVCRYVENLAIEDHNDALTDVVNIGSGVSQTVLGMAQLIQQRCEMILGFRPALHREKSGAVEQGHKQKLTFQVEKLIELGIKHNNLDHYLEIDNLLHFCKTSFQLG